MNAQNQGSDYQARTLDDVYRPLGKTLMIFGASYAAFVAVVVLGGFRDHPFFEPLNSGYIGLEASGLWALIIAITGRSLATQDLTELQKEEDEGERPRWL